MTWAQTISIVVPILLAIIVGLFYNNKQFDLIDKRFEQVDRRFEQVDKRIDDLRMDMNARFAEIHQDLREMRGLLLEALRPRTSS